MIGSWEVPIAYAALVETARHYNQWTTYPELTGRVQHLSGIRTRMLIGNWSGKLLERVAPLAADANERGRDGPACRRRRPRSDPKTG